MGQLGRLISNDETPFRCHYTAFQPYKMYLGHVRKHSSRPWRFGLQQGPGNMLLENGDRVLARPYLLDDKSNVTTNRRESTKTYKE